VPMILWYDLVCGSMIDLFCSVDHESCFRQSANRCISCNVADCDHVVCSYGKEFMITGLGITTHTIVNIILIKLSFLLQASL
jgi:hypothetical protein